MDPSQMLKSYGQSERLTHRLRNLLRDYSDGLAVLKELIQNADDAGATEVTFIYDERQNQDARTKLFSDGLAELQGPALWAYNNAMFTEDDFRNIVKLSGATKELDKAKVGRFGLGFNSVYNLTDAPSFLSGSNFAVFDPHLKYLDHRLAHSSDPGVIMDIHENRCKLEVFADQFKPFNGICGCDLRTGSAITNFEGTLFRFPLRTETQAEESEIKNTHYNHKEVMKLLGMLDEVKDSILLFTQNVIKLQVLHIESTESEFPKQTQWLTVEKSPTKPIRGQRGGKAFLVQVDEMMQQSQPCGFSKTELCQVRTQRNGQDEIFLWYVGQAVGTRESLALAKKADERLLPVAGIAAKVVAKGSKLYPCKLERGLLFCFLPLPIQVDLPVHINGYFALTHDRRSLVSPNIHDKEKSGLTWNAALFKDAIANAYTTFIDDLSSVPDVDSSPSCFDVWPNEQSIQTLNAEYKEYVAEFLRSFTDYVCSDNRKQVFPHETGWLIYNDVMALDAKFLLCSEAERSRSIEAIEEIYRTKQQQAKVVQIPRELLEMLLAYVPMNRSHILTSKLITREGFYLDIFLPHMRALPKALADEILLQDLIHGTAVLKGQKCIPVDDRGSYLALQDVIDPTSEVAKLYDDGEKVFPCVSNGALARIGCTGEEMLEVFRRYGMRKELSWDEIAGRCKRVAQIQPFRQKEYLGILLKVMEDMLKKHASITKGTKEKIKNTAFLPVMTGSPASYPRNLKWKGSEFADSSLMKPVDLRDSDKQIHLVSCVIPFIPTGLVSYRTKEFLGLNQEATLDDIMNQLKHLIALDPLQVKSEYVAIMYDTLCRVLDQKCQLLSYSQLQFLAQKPWIFTPSGFAQPAQCALYFPGGNVCAPYLHQVDWNMFQKYERLFRKTGVKEGFDIEHYASALVRIQETHGGTPLDQKTLETSLTIARLLADKMEALTTEERKRVGSVFIPDRHGIMREASSLCFIIESEAWLPQEQETLCHNKVSPLHANILGVKTLRGQKLHGRQHGIPFGQSEKLCTRLKRLVSGFESESEIIKELVQNADDAGANEIHFVLDPRHHRTDKVFDNTWGCLQGPALCVYNNSTFTNEDLQGIQDLGEGSKFDNPEKIGQFGVGFNCVYKITDTPTFLTTVDGERVLCTFDPNLYLENSTTEKPGWMYKELEYLKKMFPDVFIPFMEDTFHLQGDRGTMFRLPLRTESQAIQSKLSDTHFDASKVKRMFNVYQGNLAEIMLFLKNIKDIKFSVVTENGLQTLSQASCTLSQSDLEKKKQFFTHAKNVCKALRQQQMRIEEVRNTSVSYSIQTSSNDDENSWLVIQSFGCENESDVPEGVRYSFNMNTTPLMPIAGVAYNLSGKSTGKLYCFLPLPLPANTSLPIHINGHFILDNENRKRIKYDLKSFGREWNDFLLEKMIAPAYAELMSTVKDDLYHESSDRYHSLFPNQTHDKPMVDLVVNAVYKYIAEKEMSILPVERVDGTLEWHPPVSKENPCYFDNLTAKAFTISYLTREKEEQAAKSLGNLLKDLGIKMFTSPMSIYKNFECVKVPVEELGPDIVLGYLRQHPHTPASLPEHIERTKFKGIDGLVSVLKYCSASETFQKQLHGTPLLLTSDGQLRMFSTDAKAYRCGEKEMHKLCPSKFVHEQVMSFFRIRESDEPCVLKDLGIADISALLQQNAAILVSSQWRNTLDLSEFPDHMQPVNKWLPLLWHYIADQIRMILKTKNSQDQYPSVKSILEPLNELLLLPVKRRSIETVLIPVKLAGDVVDLSVGDDLSKHLRQLIEKFCVAEPDISLIRPGKKLQRNIIEDTFATVNDPGSILKSLGHAVSMYPAENYSLDKSESLQLVQYFANARLANSGTEYVSLLRKLPIHDSINRGICCLSNAQVYIIPENIPTEGTMHLNRNYPNVIFIKDQSCYLYTFRAFYQSLGCAEVHIVEYYTRFVFPIFSELGNDRSCHLEFLRSKLQTMRCDPNMDYALKRLAFVPNSSGGLNTADAFYSPHVAIFRKMCKPSELPPEPYDDQEWVEFLEVCGMHSKLTSEIFIKFAKQIEVDSLLTNTTNYENRDRSKTLVKLMFTDQDLTSIDLFGRVKSICFIAPESIPANLTQICPGTTSDAYVSYDGRHVSASVDLIWAANGTGFIPSWADPKEYRVLMVHSLSDVDKALGLIRSPSPELVVQNLTAVCKAVGLPSGNIENVLVKMYAELDRNLDSHLDAISGLKTVPCVLVDHGDQLVTPNRVVIEMEAEKEIKPYLFKLPQRLSPYERLFQAIGAAQEVTLHSYVAVLKELYEKQGASGDANDDETQQSTCQAYLELLKLLEKEASPKIDHLYLPTKEKTVLPSKEIVFVDRPSVRDRITELGMPELLTLEKFPMHLMPLILKHLPDHLMPKFLTEIVKETLAVDPATTQGEGRLALALQQKLGSEIFEVNFVRLVNKCASEVLQIPPEAEAIKKIIRDITVIGLDHIKTVITKEGERIGEPKEALLFVEYDHDDKILMYVTNRADVDETTRKETLHQATRELDAMFPGCKIDHLCLRDMLECKPVELPRVMESHSIPASFYAISDIPRISHIESMVLQRYPDKERAQRWLRQAEFDLQSIPDDMVAGCEFPEWACHKAHQAAEKALKAAWYALGLGQEMTHSLGSLLCRIDDAPSELRAAVRGLETVVGDVQTTRYPDRCSDVPHTRYTHTDAERARTHASAIIREIREYIN